MKDLKQLVDITSRKRIGKIDILQNPLPANSKQAKLYNIIDDISIIEEDSIAKYLYGKSADHTNNRFVKLKSRLKQKLLNTILFIEPKDKLLRLKTHSYKQLYFGKVLQFLGSYQLAKKLLKKALSVALKVELFDVAYDATFQLVTIAATTNNRNEFKNLNIDLKKYEELRKVQMSVKCKYYELSLDSKKTKQDLLKQTIDEITASSDYEQYYSLKELHYRLKVIECNNAAAYHSLINIASKAIEELSQNKYFPSESYFYFSYAAVEAFYKLNRLKDGFKFIEKVSAKSKYKPKGHDIHLIKKYEVLYAFRELDFEGAYQGTIDFITSNASKNQNGIVKEFWKLYHAYATWGIKAYLKSQGIISLNPNKKIDKDKFRLYKFLNEVPELSKDKTGYNISLLIIQFLYNLLEGNHSAIIQRVDALNVYKSRYLRGKKFKRSNTFISMLIKIERLSFKGRAIELSNLENLKYLRENPDNLPMEDCEIIPFDKLWNITIGLMTNEKDLALAI